MSRNLVTWLAYTRGRALCIAPRFTGASRDGEAAVLTVNRASRYPRRRTTSAIQSNMWDRLLPAIAYPGCIGRDDREMLVKQQ
jgi:hypothetical protein